MWQVYGVRSLHPERSTALPCIATHVSFSSNSSNIPIRGLTNHPSLHHFTQQQYCSHISCPIQCLFPLAIAFNILLLSPTLVSIPLFAISMSKLSTPLFSRSTFQKIELFLRPSFLVKMMRLRCHTLRNESITICTITPLSLFYIHSWIVCLNKIKVTLTIS